MVLVVISKHTRVVYTVNKVAYRKYHFTTSSGILKRNLQLPVCVWKIILTCYYRNKVKWRILYKYDHNTKLYWNFT